MTPMLDFGIRIIQILQSGSPAFDGLMKFISFLGTVEFYLLLIPFVYWLIDARFGFRVLLVLVSMDFWGSALKQLLRQPRPYWVGKVQSLSTETSYGIPSTHSSDSLGIWGYLSFRLKMGWLWAFAAVLVFLIGLSRLYLGVHFPLDILVGWLIALVWIFLYVKLEERATPWLRQLSAARQVGLGFGISLLMILGGLIVAYLITPYPDPASWAAYATEAREISKYFTLAGATFGAVSGYVLMQKYARFLTRGPWWQKTGRYALGMAVVLVIYFVLDMLFNLLARDASLAGYLLRYLRYGAVTLWAMFGAPWVFLKLKLADLANGRTAADLDQKRSVPALN